MWNGKCLTFSVIVLLNFMEDFISLRMVAQRDELQLDISRVIATNINYNQK